MICICVGDNRFNGSEYWHSRINEADNLNFDDAEQFCQSMSGHLASVHTREENEYIFSLVSNQSPIRWIGGRRIRKIDTPDLAPFTWKWTDGSPFTIFESDTFSCISNLLTPDSDISSCLFREDEPNDFNNREDCLSMGGGGFPGQWNDAQCRFTRQYICKRPSTLLSYDV